ncbi:MAG: aminoglycoside phosphotransferase family protein [Defluviitaleaceae bacterium]|nr:aminoglycoside phosphotransferase family protein [Defluviitaleaceae bacterium]
MNNEFANKSFNKADQYPNIVESILRDIPDSATGPARNFRLINAKSGVYVYKCVYADAPAVAKYFEKEDDRRELLNYEILARQGVPTVRVYAHGKSSLVMEDISASGDWRLGTPEDLSDARVAKGLANWYFTLHERGEAALELDALYFEYDCLTEKNLLGLIKVFPEAGGLYRFLLANSEKLREMIYKPKFTLAYNDFYWGNLVVRRDGSAAMMLDFNLLGRGYRYSDFRNVRWDMGEDAKAAFDIEYGRLYAERHGSNRTEAEELERRIDELAGDLFLIHLAFTEHERIPEWAKEAAESAKNGKLLIKTKRLLA